MNKIRIRLPFVSAASAPVIRYCMLCAAVVPFERHPAKRRALGFFCSDCRIYAPKTIGLLRRWIHHEWERWPRWRARLPLALLEGRHADYEARRMWVFQAITSVFLVSVAVGLCEVLKIDTVSARSVIGGAMIGAVARVMWIWWRLPPP